MARLTHISMYAPRNGSAPVDHARCRADVHERGRGIRFYQCQRKKKVTDSQGLGWCGQHSPAGVAKSKAKADTRYENWAAEGARLSAMKAIGQAYVDAREAGKTHKTACDAVKEMFTQVRESLSLEDPR